MFFKPVRWITRSPVALLVLMFGGCLAPHVDNTVRTTASTPAPVDWPGWDPRSFGLGAEVYKKGKVTRPAAVPVGKGHVITFGPDPDGSENLVVIGQRNKTSPDGIKVGTFIFELSPRFSGANPFLKSSVKLTNGQGNSWSLLKSSKYRSTFFRLEPTQVRPAVGTLVYLTSILLLSPPEERVLRRFRALGWNTVAALPSDSLYNSRWPFYEEGRGSVEIGASYFADQMDKHYAEQAFATEAALTYIRKTRPSWFSGKRILMGGSAGTFTLPAVAARTGGWDAAVLVGGGTEFLEGIGNDSLGALRTLLKLIDRISVEKGGELEKMRLLVPSADDYRAMLHAAATMTRLNAEELAPQLASTPVLMLDARFDKLIPPGQSERLYKALGYPERWIYPLGHSILFYNLPSQVGRLNRWILGGSPGSGSRSESGCGQ